MVAGSGIQMRAVIVAGIACLLAACVAQHPTIYSWGSYEELIYASYLSPQDVPAEKQVEVLEKDYQVARSTNHRLPPGWHAHLGVNGLALVHRWVHRNRPNRQRRRDRH